MIQSKEKFFETSLCKSGARCKECRLFADFRKTLTDLYDIDAVEKDNGYFFKCPKNKHIDDYIDADDVKFPSYFEMMKSLGKTMVNQTKTTLKGGKTIASAEFQKKRTLICKGDGTKEHPPCALYINRTHRCKQCGCKLTGKIRTAAAKCPINKWGPET